MLEKTTKKKGGKIEGKGEKELKRKRVEVTREGGFRDDKGYKNYRSRALVVEIY